MTPTSGNNIIITFAIPDEMCTLPEPLAGFSRVITGIGKVNAAYALAKAIIENAPAAVINIGTAGTTRHNIGDIIVSNRFYDRDLAQVCLPGLDYDLRTNIRPCSVIEHIVDYASSKRGAGMGQDKAFNLAQKPANGSDFMINTGDQFVVSGVGIVGDAIDMESFAEAMVCRNLNIPFLSVKYITDIVGKNSVAAWQEKLQEARKGLESFFHNIFDANHEMP